MISCIDFGLTDYEEVLNLQTKLFNDLVNSKKENRPSNEYILIGEHPSVITLGRKGVKENILISPQLLLKRGVKTYYIGRGGDVTFHNQGQLIVYPIIDLDKYKLGVKDYVSLLEEAIIRLLKKYNIKGERVEGATGVWIGKCSSQERKICAIGIKCSRFCTMHGLALNVMNDLSGFGMINPCGFTDKGVTSIQNEIPESGRKILNMDNVKKDFLHILFGLIFPFEEILYLPE